MSTLKTNKKLIVDLLTAAVNALEAKNQVKVESTWSIERYNLSHGRGALVIFYKGDDFEDKESGAGCVYQNRDMLFGVVVIIRERSNDNSMTVEDYIDFVLDSLSGHEIELLDRPDRKIRAVDVEFLKEQNGEWYYGVTVMVPATFLEKSLRSS